MWNGVSVKWERGHPVTLVMYDEEENEIERHGIEGWDVARVEETLKSRGFQHAQRTVFPTPTLGFSKTGAADRATERTQPVNPSHRH